MDETTTPPVLTHPLGLALGGGGAKSMAHLGVVQVLQENNIPIGLLVTASGGSLMGALIATGVPLRDIRREFFNRLLRIKWLKPGLNRSSVMSQDTIRRILKDFGADLSLEKTHIPFLPVATDLTHGTLKVFRSGSLVDAVCASSAFPGIYPPVRIDGTLYVDGGVLDNIPADICRSELGPRGVVVAISLDPTLTPEFNSTNAFNIIYRSIYIPLVHMRESIIRENSNLVWRIFASREANMKSWMDMLRFYSAREMEKFYQLGVRCAEKNLENLRSLLTRESPASSPEVASAPIVEEDDSRGTIP